MRISILSLFVFLLQQLNAQTPNHFTLGVEQFSKVDIYNLYVDTIHKLHVATNDGLYVYQQNKFQKYPRHNKQKGNSFFDFKTDNYGQLFCKNLNGQIFKIKNGKLELVYQLPEEYNGIFHYFFDSTNELNILNSEFYKIDAQGEKVVLIELEDKKNERRLNFNNPSFGADGSIICKYGANDTTIFLIYHNGIIDTINPELTQWQGNRKNKKNSKVFIYNLNGQTFLFGKDSTLGKLNPNLTINTTASYNEIVAPLSKDMLIGMHRSRGYRLFYLEGDVLEASPYYLTNTFISSAFLSHTGTLYLGTFNKGVIVVPNYAVISYISDNQFRGIAVTPENVLYLSTRDGKTVKFEEHIEIINNARLHNDRLYYVKHPNYTSDSSHIITDSMYGQATIKDTYETPDGIYLATNSGINFMSHNTDLKPAYFSYIISTKFSTYKPTEKFTTVAFDSDKNLLYHSNFRGTFIVDSIGESEKIKYKDKDIFTIDIELFQGNMVLGTESQGIFIYNEHIQKNITKADGLRSNRIKKIKVKAEFVYVLFHNGMQIINLKTYKIQDIGRSEGIRTKFIANFDLSDDRLWITENDRFYSVELAQLFDTVQKLNFSLDSILVNNAIINTRMDNEFEFKQNAFSLYVDYSDIVKLEDAYYTYKLIGFDNALKTMPAAQNLIEYQSLPPGKYTFQIAVNYRDSKSETYSYTFEILVPFWQRWWFYTFILLLFGTIIFFIFHYKMKRQAKEASRRDELNSSKLIAIQSQMNPHFVFNALNSIQHLVMLGDKDQSYTHITSFANLVRRTLEYSEQETISVYEEIQLLEVYLSLEKLRFSGDFEYEMKYENLPKVQVPPMLIQPFVENALIHGLMHKKGKKNLTVTLEVKDVLICTIEDNGVGRAAINAIKERQMDNHKSFAVNAIENRFKILRSYYDESIGYTYEDFKPNEDQAVVTRLILRIPLKLNSLK